MTMQRKLTPVLLCIVWLAACTAVPQKRSEQAPGDTARPVPSQQTQTRPKQPLPPPPPPVAIIVSRELAPYTEVASRLSHQLGDKAHLFALPTTPAEKQQLVRKVGQMEHAQLVAIGMDATLLAAQIPEHNQVFCQVFNYTENGLITERRKGVSMLPGVKKIFATWKTISPSLQDAAVISGPGLDTVLQRAQKAAEKQGVTLHPVTVNNDKEYLYAYKQLADKVQGYWLLPDNRVLSVRTLREVMTFSVRNGKQVVVFNDELLRLGGLFSVESDYDDIAAKVLMRLRQAENRDSIPGSELLPLDEVRLKINPVMAQRLGLSVPEQYREHSGEKTPD